LFHCTTFLFVVGWHTKETMVFSTKFCEAIMMVAIYERDPDGGFLVTHDATMTFGHYESNRSGMVVTYTGSQGEPQRKEFDEAAILGWDVVRVSSSRQNYFGTRVRIAVLPLPSQPGGNDTYNDWLVTLTVPGDQFVNLKGICAQTFPGPRGLGPRRKHIE
jgi:hypothetical protein